MQDNYIGDIGDYGKYGLLREVCAAGLSLAVNWYKVIPTKPGKQDDGKYTSYLSMPQIYRDYDPAMFDSLKKIVMQEQDRRIARIEQEKLFSASFYSVPLGNNREEWHVQALEKTKNANVVFLDPDNGLETEKMHQTGKPTEKHVAWAELKDYYARGQNVILYQHRPQMTTKEKCIESVMHFQRSCLQADSVKLLAFPKYTNRFYFMFLHGRDQSEFQRICTGMVQKWGKNDYCYEINLDSGEPCRK